MKPRKPSTRKTWIARSGKPMRKAKSFVRAYESEERVEFIKSLPCTGCGVTGYSENAHVGREGKGAGRKANADQITPLCGPHGLMIGCHRAFDRFLFPFNRASTRIPVILSCVDTQRKWLARHD